MFPAAALAVIIASLILGVALVAASQSIESRQTRDSVFLMGLAFVALAVLITVVAQALARGGSP
jgi:hypothetical protein